MIELRLDEGEAKSLADAAGEVMSHYGVSFLDDKTTAWVNLAQVAFGIYGTRIMANRMRRATERENARKAQQTANDAARANPTGPAPPSETRFTRTVIPGVGEVDVPMPGQTQQ